MEQFDLYFNQPIDWESGEDDIDDDELLSETPQDVIDILGFDPLDDIKDIEKADAMTQTQDDRQEFLEAVRELRMAVKKAMTPNGICGQGD